MGLFDSFENQATNLLERSSNPLASGLLQMIQSHPGGLQGFLQSFHDQGMGEIASSWVSTNNNLPISSDQVHQVLGSDQVRALAAKAGISPEVAGGVIAQVLPALVDKLTPNGQVPAHNTVMSMIGGLLQNAEKAS